MRVLLDACVLVPTLTRALMMRLADKGAIDPVWSPQILAEWQHAAQRSGPIEALAVTGEIAVMNARHPTANVTPNPSLIASLFLPDPNDTHVLAAAVTDRVADIVTFNIRDFPTRTLAAYGIHRYHPDTILLQCLSPALEDLLRSEISRAEAATGLSARGLLKKSQLPRLAKALYPKG